jgi:hypothetical protein
MAMNIRLAAALLIITTSCHNEPGNNLQIESNSAVNRYEKLLTHRRPQPEIINQVENRLSREPCVGSLDRWERLYSFGQSGGEVDESVINFAYREAGRFGFVSGRRITSPDEWVNLDDRPYLIMTGYFVIGENRLVIRACGPNTVER